MDKIFIAYVWDYEGPEWTSYHKTKKGAYKALNKYLNEQFKEKRNEFLMYGKRDKYMYYTLFDHPVNSTSLKIKVIILGD